MAENGKLEDENIQAHEDGGDDEVRAWSFYDIFTTVASMRVTYPAHRSCEGIDTDLGADDLGGRKKYQQ